MKKLSIVTINLNNLIGLASTLKSIKDQVTQDFEHIVIDGGSTDGSRELIEENWQRFSYWVSEKDDGIYHAINKGISKATGDYILVLNSGDILADENTLKKVIPYLESGVDIIYGNAYLVNDKSGRTEEIAPDELSFHFFELTNLIHQSIFIRRELHSRIGLYDEDLKIVSDWKFYLDAIIKGEATHKKIPLHICRYDRTGLSSTSTNKLLEEKNGILKSEFSFFTKRHEIKYPLSLRQVVKNILPYGFVERFKKIKRQKKR